MANIIITGANQGIGYYFTEQALKDGNRVAVLDIETDHLKDLAQVFPKQLLCCKADVCDDIQIDTAVKEIVAVFFVPLLMRTIQNLICMKEFSM